VSYAARCSAVLPAKKGGDDDADYAQDIPARVIAPMLGVAEQDGDRFRKWIHEVLELGITDIPTLVRAKCR
jgi:cytochrome P450